MSSMLLPSGLSPHELRNHMDCIRATKPPYTCPISGCGRIYKSFSGIQSHLTKFKHTLSPRKNDERSEENRSVGATHAVGRNEDTVVNIAGHQRPVQQLSWTQAQKIIDVEVNGKIMRLNTLEPMPVSFVLSGDTAKAEEKKSDPIPMPAAVFKEIKEFEPPKMKCFPTSYIRYIEKTPEELDEEIEYDMDEEDDAWLGIINELRLRVGLPRVSEATFEFVMNRLEKDSYFKTSPATALGHNGMMKLSDGRHLDDDDDDTVCGVCGDGECDNANAILFCDMCNLAVHQECYGVPYIPEGQWLCRRCQLSPSRSVDCRLCPNKGGAFKQTSDNGWAHVVCALWVPEVQFANTVFLEPIEGFERIPPARWKLTCYICKQKSRGACIQCHKPSCYTAFHVTCAQQAGLYMKMETVVDPKSSDGGLTVRKSAFCDLHAPSNGADSTSNEDKGKNESKNESEVKSRPPESSIVTPKFDMRRARKLLNQKRKLSPTVSVPVVPRRNLEQLAHQLRFAGKQEFLDRVLRYWTLKRRSRFGVPLLRRLQVTHHANRLEKERLRNKELQGQYNSWRQLRQDLEKARLLMELVRKRERKKKEYVQVAEDTWEELLWTPQRYLLSTIDQLEAIDENRVFTQPVDDAEVPGYSRIIKSPMDLSTMREKATQLEYKDFNQMEKDFDLMMANCMKFNVQNEYYKSYGTKYKKKGLEILRQASEDYTQLKECQMQLLVDLQRYDVQDDTIPVQDESTEHLAEDTPSTSKKSVGKKQKLTQIKPPPAEIPAFGDMPKLVAMDGKSKAKQPDASNTSPSTEQTRRGSSAGTSQAKPAKKKAPPPSKKQIPKSKKAAPATSKKTQQKRGGSEKMKKSDDDEDDDDEKPLTALLGQTHNSLKAAAENDNFVSPVDVTESSRPSFRMFREDRKSPNSSAVESELEPASGDERCFIRTNAMLASTSAAVDGPVVDQLIPEHLDFVWARVEGRPWLPGVVIDPNIEYGPQSAVRYVPSEAVLNDKVANAYLIMLFDETKSWLWLKRDSLQMLGLDPEVDRKRLQEAGPAQKTVIQAYERALEARSLVMGGDLDVDDDQSGPPVIDEYRSSEEATGTESSATTA